MQHIIRLFIIGVLVFAGGVCNTLAAENEPQNGIIFPRAFAIAIDDMGWMDGSNISHLNGPYRVGIRRNFDVRDYAPFIEIGQALGIRFQGLFILGEMDRENIVRTICPNASKDGALADNSRHVGPLQVEIMEYVKANAANLELGLHGVGHEFWEDGKRTRAEWYNLEDRVPRDEAVMMNHLLCYEKILAQYGISEAEGHSFPESFVPCAYGYFWNPGGDYTTGKLVAPKGVKYINTQFSTIRYQNPPERASGAFDNGTLVLDRINYGNAWYAAGALPREPVDNYETDFIEAHWANFLATDEFLQAALNRQWISFFRKIQAHPNHYLAKNTEQLNSQWLYKKYATVAEPTPGKVIIDNRNMPGEAYQNELLGNMVLALALKNGENLSGLLLNGKPLHVFYQAEGYTYICLPVLDRQIYQLEYTVGEKEMPLCIIHNGTYNIYETEAGNRDFRFRLKMYGTQEVQIKTKKPASVNTDSNGLVITSQAYDESTGTLTLGIAGRDMQGEMGNVVIGY